MANIVYEVLPDDNVERCDRCKSTKYPRIGFIISPSLHETGEVMFPKGKPRKAAEERQARVVMCSMCLAHAIQTVTGWDMQSIVLRYAAVSPRFGSVPVQPASSIERIKRRNPPVLDIRHKSKSPTKRN